MNIRRLCLASLLPLFLIIQIGRAESASPWNDSFLGVCSQVTRETPQYNPFKIHEVLMDTIKGANIHFTRFGFKWHTIHPAKDEWDWRIADAVVASAKERDLQVLALISGMPKHIFDAPQEHIGLWLEFVDSLTSRYAEDIFHWEIWNEPNLKNGKYWPQSELPGPYGTYVVEATRKIRHNQPEATILLGGLATNKRSKPFKTWDALFQMGVLEHVDGIAYHTYQYTGEKLIDLNLKLSELVAKYSEEEKAFWITEYGVPGIDSNQFPQVSYQTQSQNIQKSVITHWATGGAKFFVFSIWDKAVFKPNQTRKQLKQTRTYYYGLLEKGLSPKPSYTALQWLAPLLDSYVPLEIQQLDSGVSIKLQHKTDASIAYFSWGSSGLQEMRQKTATLSFCESSETQWEMNNKQFRQLNLPVDEVLFWR